MRKAVDAADKHSTYDLIEQLQAENQILKHQVLGYEKVFKFKKRRKHKGKPLFELQDGETMGWYSPKKVNTAREQLQQLEEDKREQQELKKEEKLRKKAEKEDKQQQKAARKLEREKSRAEKAAQVALKKARKEEIALQKLLAKQLQAEAKSSKHKQTKCKQTVQLDSVAESSNSGVGGGTEVILEASRSGRLRKQPKHLQNYAL